MWIAEWLNTVPVGILVGLLVVIVAVHKFLCEWFRKPNLVTAIIVVFLFIVLALIFWRALWL